MCFYLSHAGGVASQPHHIASNQHQIYGPCFSFARSHRHRAVIDGCAGWFEKPTFVYLIQFDYVALLPGIAKSELPRIPLSDEKALRWPLKHFK